MCTAGLRLLRYLRMHAHSCINFQSRDAPGCLEVKVIQKAATTRLFQGLESYYLTTCVYVFSRTYLHVQLEDLQRELTQRSTVGNNSVGNNRSR